MPFRLSSPKRSLLENCWSVMLALVFCCPQISAGQDVSSPAFLQVFDAKWETVEDRMADIFVAGYARLWLPPPARADSGTQSVGYDVFDRFDLGQPRNETAYGTETGLKTLIEQAHRAGIRVNTDYIANHNGFSDSSTVDTFGTPGAGDDVSFLDAGGYPGFLLTLNPADDPNGVGAIDGDFHSAFETGEETFRLSGLIDINQSLNHQFIRHPVEAGNPMNIPAAGTTGIFGRPPQNVPDPNNARFYPDQDLGGTTVFDPRLNQNVVLYDFNRDNPLAGDAVTDNATGLLVRNLRWMIQEIGVDGFRYDAARHFPHWVLDFLDQGAFRASDRTLLNGAPEHPFTFIETGGDDRLDFLQGFIRKDIDNNNLGQVGGNRDALDFNLFFSLRENLSSNGLVNDWRSIKNRSIDANDDGLANNGSQGVAFVQSHDDGPAHLNNVAHAYALLRPGNALVYLNADQFDDPFRDFPKPGREDALGGMFGDTVTTLVGIRTSYGRGNYLDRTPAADEKELLIYERENSALVVLNNRLDSGFDSRTVQTSFAPGTPLIELTGNASNSVVDPNNDLPELLVVKPDGTVDLRAVRNRTGDTEHGQGYLIYGVAKPQGELRLTDASGQDLTAVLPGSTPQPGDGGPNGPSDTQLNGTTRLTDITVIQDPTFKLRIETDAVNLLGSVRDRHADGDFAQFRIDEGRDRDGNIIADVVDPGDVGYAFTNFTEVNSPGFFSLTGEGVYEQAIDASKLAEGRHYLTGRVFRHRNPGTFTDGDESLRGDGGPAVFTEFREVVYVDLLPPEAALASFDPFASDPGNLANRDLVVRSVDKTADNMHIFLNLPANVTDEEIFAMVQQGIGDAGDYDRDSFVFGFTGLTSGNHTVTVVTFEETGTSNIQRFSGLEALTLQTGIGLGVGDLDADGDIDVSDLTGAGGFEQVLMSANGELNPAADVTADGLVDNRDLFLLDDVLLAAGASPAVLEEYEEVLQRRGDLDGNGSTGTSDVLLLLEGLGSSRPALDVNVDGVVDNRDVETLYAEVFRSTPGDFDLNGVVNAGDYVVLRDTASGAASNAAFALFASAFGQSQTQETSDATSVPEPSTPLLTATALGLLLTFMSRQASLTGGQDAEPFSRGVQR